MRECGRESARERILRYELYSIVRNIIRDDPDTPTTAQELIWDFRLGPDT
jgi:hypothetical protein